MAKSAPPEAACARRRLAVAGCSQSAASRRGCCAPGFNTAGWYAATVPGTVLTTLVNNHVYPEPLYGENNRPEVIPESLARTSYWYRTQFEVPKSYEDRHVWLNFDGINYSADVWVNGAQVGTMRGAFIRGIFDITALVTPGSKAVVAVLVTPQPHPGVPTSIRCATALGQNGGDDRDRRPDVSLARSAGTGFRRFATATPASGKRFFSPPPARWL